MKTRTVLLLYVGFVSVIANPASKETADAENDKTPLLETIEPETTFVDESSSIANSETPSDNGVKFEISESVPNIEENIVATFNSADEDAIEENIINPPMDVFPQMETDLNVNYEPIFDDSYRFVSMNKVQDEIMETAAGFAPLPFFRKRQKPRRRYVTRRNFRRNPYRNAHFFYPYYGFYYNPSSLRYFY
ncbi:uncharacterized protein LOC115456328 [Manduca sexta]|uniref:uncharacterized protein LOC115456328 n=1 Tax=Manduca sexta TaxID=7130 RepID=UPI0011843BEB|nr:uncharacterized protein LOC115456328 [Manduca sexta]XP_030041217.1 uncharacterized protein LOC115456328 [Manduca sexta]